MPAIHIVTKMQRWTWSGAAGTTSLLLTFAKGSVLDILGNTGRGLEVAINEAYKDEKGWKHVSCTFKALLNKAPSLPESILSFSGLGRRDKSE
jgi:hypothetical protein